MEKRIQILLGSAVIVALIVVLIIPSQSNNVDTLEPKPLPEKPETLNKTTAIKFSNLYEQGRRYNEIVRNREVTSLGVHCRATEYMRRPVGWYITVRCEWRGTQASGIYTATFHGRSKSQYFINRTVIIRNPSQFPTDLHSIVDCSSQLTIDEDAYLFKESNMTSIRISNNGKVNIRNISLTLLINGTTHETTLLPEIQTKAIQSVFNITSNRTAAYQVVIRSVNCDAPTVKALE